MLSFTTTLAGRDARDLKLTIEEANELFSKGFQFAEFSPEAGRFRLRVPYQIAENRDRGTLTIMQ